MGSGISIARFFKDRRESRHDEIHEHQNGADAHQREQRRIGHRRDDIAAQIVARALEFGEPLEYHCQRAAGFACADHVDVQLREVVRVSGQAVGQRPAAFEDAQNVQDQGAEGGAIGQFGGDGERAIHRHARAEQRGEFLSEEQDVALPAAGEGRQLDFDGFLRFLTDIDRRETLAAQLERDQALGLGVNRAGANLSIGCDGPEVEVASYRTPNVARVLLFRGARTHACRVHTRVNTRFTAIKATSHPHAVPAPPSPHLSRRPLAVPHLASAWQPA